MDMLRAALEESQLLVQLIKYGWCLKPWGWEALHLPIHTLSFLLRYRFDMLRSHMGEIHFKKALCI